MSNGNALAAAMRDAAEAIRKLNDALLRSQRRELEERRARRLARERKSQ